MKISVAVLFLCCLSICTLQRFVEGACPIGWKSYQSACYAAFTTLQNFNYWKSYCVELGGHLASVHSSGELNAIKGIISSGPNIGYYIGLNDIYREGRWEYTDGTMVNYVNWNTQAGEPSNQANEDCAVMNSNGMWYDDICSKFYGAICKIGIGCNLPLSWDSNLNVEPDVLFYPNGVSVSYYCDEGYYLEGESRATCEDGEFDPPEAPECAERIECHTWRNVVCDPSSEICDTSGNTEKTIEMCEGPIQQCFVHHYTIEGDGVKLDATAGGCVTNSDLGLGNGCYGRSYLPQIDPPGNEELSQLEEAIGFQSDDVNVCVCDRDICNESVETAERNSATISATVTNFSLAFASMFTIISCQM